MKKPLKIQEVVAWSHACGILEVKNYLRRQAILDLCEDYRVFMRRGNESQALTHGLAAAILTEASESLLVGYSEKDFNAAVQIAITALKHVADEAVSRAQAAEKEVRELAAQMENTGRPRIEPLFPPKQPKHRGQRPRRRTS